MVARLDVRLDDERRQRLEEIAREQGAPISDVVRSLIDDAWEAIMLERRLQAVREIASIELDVPDDPQDLCDELNARYDSTDLS